MNGVATSTQERRWFVLGTFALSVFFRWCRRLSIIAKQANKEMRNTKACIFFSFRQTITEEVIRSHSIKKQHKKPRIICDTFAWSLGNKSEMQSSSSPAVLELQISDCKFTMFTKSKNKQWIVCAHDLKQNWINFVQAERCSVSCENEKRKREKNEHLTHRGRC